MNPTAIIEAILFVATKPLTIKKLAQIAALDSEVVEAALVDLKDTYEKREAGLTLVQSGNAVELATAPAYSSYIESFFTTDFTGELTKAQLETMTIIAYQQPITKPELEEIRGVNSAVILRTLLLRGLIHEKTIPEKILPIYELTTEALRKLGITGVAELPEYETLNQHPHFEEDDEDLFYRTTGNQDN